MIGDIRRFTIDEVKNFVKTESDCLLLSDEYFGEKNKMRFKCKCGNEFITTYGDFKYSNKRQCNDCSWEINASKDRLSYEYVEQQIEKYGYKLISDEYKNAFKKLTIMCDKGHVFDIDYNGFQQGARCSECNGIHRYRTPESYRLEIKELYGDEYEVIGTYINNSTNIDVKHKNCGNTWSVNPNSLLSGHGCPKCSHRSYKKSQEEFEKEVFDLVGGEYTVLGEYTKNDKKIYIKHNICKHEYYVSPINFLKGRRCPVCNESKGEKTVRKLLEDNNISFLPQYNKFNDLTSDLGNPLRFDFAVFIDNNKTQLKCLIEYDGEFHFEKQYDNDGFEMIKLHDGRKNAYCIKNGIWLIRIPYWEFNNIESILKNKKII
jgi:hypothetical protein